MACADHTTRSRPPELFWLINEPQLPPDPEQAKRHANLMRISGVSLAMYVIRHLLKRYETPPSTRTIDQLPDDHNLPRLSPTQVQGLRAALYFVRLQGDQLLQNERDG
jgi:hypothetical protein